MRRLCDPETRHLTPDGLIFTMEMVQAIRSLTRKWVGEGSLPEDMYSLSLVSLAEAMMELGLKTPEFIEDPTLVTSASTGTFIQQETIKRLTHLAKNIHRRKLLDKVLRGEKLSIDPAYNFQALSEQDVRDISHEWLKKTSVTSLCRLYGVSTSTIYKALQATGVMDREE